METYQHHDTLLLLRTLVELFRRPSPSGREELVRDYVVSSLENCGCTVHCDPAGNVLAQRGTLAPGQGYPLLSFHMDTVEPGYSYPLEGRPTREEGESWQAFRQRELKHSFATRVLLPLHILPPSALRVSQGWIQMEAPRILGGDDKCGAAIALTLAAQTTHPLKIVASVREEEGCIGIGLVDPTFFADVSYALVLDRRGHSDLITHIARMPLCRPVFLARLVTAAAQVGVPIYPTEGALSDAVVLSRHIQDVVNLSVGYYHPHTLDERVSLSDLINASRWVRQILRTVPHSAPTRRKQAQDAVSVHWGVSEAHLPAYCRRCGDWTMGNRTAHACKKVPSTKSLPV